MVLIFPKSNTLQNNVLPVLPLNVVVSVVLCNFVVGSVDADVEKFDGLVSSKLKNECNNFLLY